MTVWLAFALGVGLGVLSVLPAWFFGHADGYRRARVEVMESRRRRLQ